MTRFQDRLDEMADRLADAAETYVKRKNKLLRLLEMVRSDYDGAILAADVWAVRERLIPSVDWTDDQGEPFLPVSKLQIVQDEPTPDAATMLRERAASLRDAEDDEGES